MTDVYGMDDLSPASFDKLSEQFMNDEVMAHKYQFYQGVQGPKYLSFGHSHDWQEDIYCQTRNSVYFDEKDCLSQRDHQMIKDPVNTLLEYMCDPWYETVN
jgi:hypothetical protein